MENEFLSISEVDNDVNLYELKDSEINDSSDLQIEKNLYMFGNFDSSRSQPQNKFTPHDNSIRIGNHTPIPRHPFEIEGEMFMIASYDSNGKAIISSDKELWIKAIDGKIESMRSNHI